jgi:hypothetical protein
MVFNSIRISWIAFLSRKKKSIALSFVITTLFIVNINNSSGDNIHSQIINAFSPAQAVQCDVMIYGSIYFFFYFTTLFHLPTAELMTGKLRK